MFANTEIKIAIMNIRPARPETGNYYGSFAVIIRQFDDFDESPRILQQFINLSLDPGSNRFIGKVIGDKYYYFDRNKNRILSKGDYELKSKYIRVEISNDILNKSIDTSLIPWGFDSLLDISNNVSTPPVSFVTSQKILQDDELDPRIYYGFNFYNTDSLQYCCSVDSSLTKTINPVFTLDDCGQGQLAPSLGSGTLGLSHNKFIIPFQGGFDGCDPSQTFAIGQNITSTNLMGFNLSSPTGSGTLMYKRALNTIKNPKDILISDIFVPGIIAETHKHVVQQLNMILQQRQDCVGYIDCGKQDDECDIAVSNVENINTSFLSTPYN